LYLLYIRLNRSHASECEFGKLIQINSSGFLIPFLI
jgi:hypothetical protein